MAISEIANTINCGGRIVLVGLPIENEVPVDIAYLIDSEIDIYGVFRYANTYPTAIQALSSSDIDIEKVITHKYSLHDIREAVEKARTEKDTSIKIMIYLNGEHVD